LLHELGKAASKQKMHMTGVDEARFSSPNEILNQSNINLMEKANDGGEGSSRQNASNDKSERNSRKISRSPSPKSGIIEYTPLQSSFTNPGTLIPELTKESLFYHIRVQEYYDKNTTEMVKYYNKKTDERYVVLNELYISYEATLRNPGNRPNNGLLLFDIHDKIIDTIDSQKNEKQLTDLLLTEHLEKSGYDSSGSDSAGSDSNQSLKKSRDDSPIKNNLSRRNSR